MAPILHYKPLALALFLIATGSTSCKTRSASSAAQEDYAGRANTFVGNIWQIKNGNWPLLQRNQDPDQTGIDYQLNPFKEFPDELQQANLNQIAHLLRKPKSFQPPSVDRKISVTFTTLVPNKSLSKQTLTITSLKELYFYIDTGMLMPYKEGAVSKRFLNECLSIDNERLSVDLLDNVKKTPPARNLLFDIEKALWDEPPMIAQSKRSEQILYEKNFSMNFNFIIVDESATDIELNFNVDSLIQPQIGENQDTPILVFIKDQGYCYSIDTLSILVKLANAVLTRRINTYEKAGLDLEAESLLREMNAVYLKNIDKRLDPMRDLLKQGITNVKHQIILHQDRVKKIHNERQQLLIQEKIDQVSQFTQNSEAMQRIKEAYLEIEREVYPPVIPESFERIFGPRNP